MHLVAATTRESAPTGRNVRTALIALVVLSGVVATFAPTSGVENVAYCGAAVGAGAMGLGVWLAWRLVWGRQASRTLRTLRLYQIAARYDCDPGHVWKLIRGVARQNRDRRAD